MLLHKLRHHVSRAPQRPACQPGALVFSRAFWAHQLDWPRSVVHPLGGVLVATRRVTLGNSAELTREKTGM